MPTATLPLRLLSFFPSARVESTYTEIVLPFGGYVISSDTPAPGMPQLQEIDFDDLPPGLAEDMGIEWATEEDAPRSTASDPSESALGFASDMTIHSGLQCRLFAAAGRARAGRARRRPLARLCFTRVWRNWQTRRAVRVNPPSASPRT